MADTLKAERDGEANLPVWESNRYYSRIDIENNYYVEGRTGTLWEDEQTGLITSDPKKFEAWLDSLTSP